MTWGDVQQQIANLIQENKQLKAENDELKEQRDHFYKWWRTEKERVKLAKKEILSLVKLVQRVREERNEARKKVKAG